MTSFRASLGTHPFPGHSASWTGMAGSGGHWGCLPKPQPKPSPTCALILRGPLALCWGHPQGATAVGSKRGVWNLRCQNGEGRGQRCGKTGSNTPLPPTGGPSRATKPHRERKFPVTPRSQNWRPHPHGADTRQSEAWGRDALLKVTRQPGLDTGALPGTVAFLQRAQTWAVSSPFLSQKHL